MSTNIKPMVKASPPNILVCVWFKGIIRSSRVESIFERLGGWVHPAKRIFLIDMDSSNSFDSSGANEPTSGACPDVAER